MEAEKGSGETMVEEEGKGRGQAENGERKKRRKKRKAILWDMVGIENGGGERQNIGIPH